MTGWRSRLLGLTALAWLGWAVYRLVVLLPSRVLNFDFNHYYTSSWLARQGISPYRADLVEISRQLGFVPTEPIVSATNPPPLLWLVAPLTWWSPVTAFWVWTAFLVLAWGVWVWLTLDLVGGRLTCGSRLVCVAYLGAAMTVSANLQFGHVELVLAALLVGAYRCLRAGRGGWAVGLVSVAGLLKLFPFGWLPWVVWRAGHDGKSRSRYGLLALALVVAGGWASGWWLWLDFVTQALPVVSRLAIGYLGNFSLASWAGNLVLVLRHELGADWPRALADAVAAVVGVVTVAAGYVYCARGGRSLETEFCVVSFAVVLGSLTAWGFYFVLLMFAVVVAATRLAGTRQWLWFVAGVLMMEVLQVQTGGVVESSKGLWVMANYLPLYGALVVVGLLVRTKAP